MWLRIMLRKTATRGMVKITLPPDSSDHGVIKFWSLAAAMAERASGRFFVKKVGVWAWVFCSDWRIAGPPTGATSSCGVSTVILAQRGIWAMCEAKFPMLIDFVCGFQSHLSSGTRSIVLRALAIS